MLHPGVINTVFRQGRRWGRRRSSPALGRFPVPHSALAAPRQFVCPARPVPLRRRPGPGRPVARIRSRVPHSPDHDRPQQVVTAGVAITQQFGQWVLICPLRCRGRRRWGRCLAFNRLGADPLELGQKLQQVGGVQAFPPPAPETFGLPLLLPVLDAQHGGERPSFQLVRCFDGGID